MLQISSKYSEIMGKIGNVKAERSHPCTPTDMRADVSPASARRELPIDQLGNRAMKAILCTRPGSARRSRACRLSRPGRRPRRGRGPGRRGRAEFLRHADHRRQVPVSSRRFPFSPGAEFAGMVESVGAGVTGFAPGDRVIGYAGYGAARERIAIAAEQAGQAAAGLDFDRAAGLTVTYGTSYYALKDRAELKPRRDARGARRLRRRRARGRRARQADGRARHRLRLVRRQARLRARARRRRGGELRAATICATRSSGSAASTAST